MGGGQIHSQIGPIKIDIEIKLMPTFADSGVLLATARGNRCCNKNILFFFLSRGKCHFTWMEKLS